MKTSFAAVPPSPAALLAPAPGRPNQAISESYRALSQNADITLTTKEGDRITISSQSAVSQQRRAEISTDGSQRLLEQRMAASGMSFAVQGDLNEQEVADLTSLLADLNGIATDFFNGNLEEAVNGAMNIGDMGSISRLEATFSQTSLLADYLSVPHPLPNLSGQEHGLYADGLDDTLAPPLFEQSMTDLLAAQWQQFLEALNRPDDDATSEAPPLANRPHPQSHPRDNSADSTGKAMVERSKETMAAHPRLTPLIPSLAGLAIEQARRQFGQSPHANQLAKDTGAAFNKAFNSWML